jgi:hypothetical protein
MAALAEALLSPRSAAVPVAVLAAPEQGGPVPQAAVCPLPSDAPVPVHESPPRGVYVLVPAGIEPSERRRTALDVAARLVPHGGTAAVLIFEGGVADAHILGEPACGRLGPQNFMAAAGEGDPAFGLVGRCDQVVITLLDMSCAPPAPVAAQALRAVFVSAADPESAVETYRAVKAWRSRGLPPLPSLFVVGGDGPDEAARLHRRLSLATRKFLGCDLASQGFAADDSCGPPARHPEPLCVLTQAPAALVWPWLMPAAREETAAPEAAPPVQPLARCAAAAHAEPVAAIAGEHSAAAADEPCAVFSTWQPQGEGELLAAIEAQTPEFLGGSLRQILRVDVAEAGAPPLAAVRTDGGLVAVLIHRAGEPVDTQAACRWLTVHRSLLGRAYPGLGIQDGPEPAAIVLAPVEPPGDGTRRFLAVRLGGHRGIVLVP